MGRLVQFLQKKESLEKYLIGQCIHLIESAQCIPLRRVSLVAVGFLLLMMILPTIFNSSDPDSGLKYTLVEPGSYRPRTCSQWKFEEGTQDQLDQALIALRAVASLHNASVVSSNQMGIPFCALEVQGQGTLINPKLVSRSGASAEYAVKLNSLCGPNNASKYKAKLSQEISLSWVQPNRDTKLNKFEGQLAYELQVSLLVLRGEDVCQQKVTTLK